MKITKRITFVRYDNKSYKRVELMTYSWYYSFEDEWHKVDDTQESVLEQEYQKLNNIK